MFNNPNRKRVLQNKCLFNFLKMYFSIPEAWSSSLVFFSGLKIDNSLEISNRRRWKNWEVKRKTGTEAGRRETGNGEPKTEEGNHVFPASCIKPIRSLTNPDTRHPLSKISGIKNIRFRFRCHQSAFFISVF